MPLKKQAFERLLRNDLMPLFPRSELSDAEPRHSRALASYSTRHAQTAIRLQPGIDSDFAYLIRRSQEFDDREKAIMEAFVEHSALPFLSHESPFAERLQIKQMDIVIAAAVSRSAGNPAALKTVAKVFEDYEQWAQETYEGHRISAAVGIDDCSHADNHGPALDAYLKLNLAKVIGDGCTTMVVLSTDGSLLRHQHLGQPDEDNRTLAPFSFVPMANWASSKKIAIALNRAGEILVFSEGRITFARRRGRWVHFSHESAIRQMAVHGPRGFSETLRRAAYLTAIDISFARVGGAIGLVRRTETVVGPGLPIQRRDQLDLRESDKTHALYTLIENRSYHELGRPLRQELGAIDGAVVVLHDGRVLTAGAVLGINISSDEGARKTAAKTLGKHGLGIKISSDGKIEAYTGEPTPEQTPLFDMG